MRYRRKATFVLHLERAIAPQVGARHLGLRISLQASFSF